MISQSKVESVKSDVVEMKRSLAAGWELPAKLALAATKAAPRSVIIWRSHLSLSTHQHQQCLLI